MKNPINIIFKAISNIGFKRSSRWPSVRGNWLKSNPRCSACGSPKDVEVHHIKSFHEHPDLELDDSNFITLCESIGSNHHLKIGHNFNGRTSWKVNNPDVVASAKEKLFSGN